VNQKKTKKERSKCRKEKRKVCREVQIKPIIIKIKTIKTEVKKELKVPKALPITPVKKEAKKEAIKKCGNDKDEKDCRKKVREEVRKKEEAFRKVALDQCDCKNSKKKDKCRRDCLREACKIRSKNECKDEKGKKCPRSHTKECREAQDVKSPSPVRRIFNAVKKLLKPTIVKNNCRKRSGDQCGKDVKQLKCRVDYKKTCIKKEKEFRRDSLKKCGCKSKHSDADKRSSCRRKCLKKACKARSSSKCGSGNDINSQNCRLTSNTRCKVFHLDSIPKKVQRRIRRSCRRRARKNCTKGSDKEKRTCLDKNRIQCINLENEFRVSALEKGESRKKAKKACENKKGDSKKKCIKKNLRSYRKKTLKEACNGSSNKKRCLKIHANK